jgi:hypothetical protein
LTTFKSSDRATDTRYRSDCFLKVVDATLGLSDAMFTSQHERDKATNKDDRLNDDRPDLRTQPH